ncbi:MAG: hypothetical protein ABSF83_13630, partial [Nitrososphaerales archaeon]
MRTATLRGYSSAVIIAIIFLGGLVVTSINVTGAPTLGIDGSAKAGCGYTGNCSLSLTTTQADDVIIVACDCWPYGGAFGVTDSAGLTFQPRTGQVSIGGDQFIQEWYAIAPSALSSDVISVQTSLTGETWYGIVAFAVQGADTANPFDANPSLPKAQANLVCPGNVPCSTGVSTSGPDLVYQFGGDT